MLEDNGHQDIFSSKIKHTLSTVPKTFWLKVLMMNCQVALGPDALKQLR